MQSLNLYNPPVISLEKKKNVPSRTVGQCFNNRVCGLNLYHLPVISLEKKKSGHLYYTVWPDFKGYVEVSRDTWQVLGDTSTWPSKSGHLYYIVWPDFEGYVEVLRDTWQVSRDTSTWPSKSGHLYYIVWPDFEGYVEVSRNTWQVLPDTSTGLSTLRPRGALGFGLAKIYKSIYIFSFYVLFAFLLIKSKIDLMRGFVDFLFNELRGCYVRQAPHCKSRFPVREWNENWKNIGT